MSAFTSTISKFQCQYTVSNYTPKKHQKQLITVYRLLVTVEGRLTVFNEKLHPRHTATKHGYLFANKYNTNYATPKISLTQLPIAV